MRHALGRILVVDDDPDILKLTAKVLTDAQHVVVTAPDAIRAMELLNSGPIDLLLADANLPIYSGYDLITTLRHDRRFAHLSIAMLTGLRKRKDIEKAIEVGIDDYIVKPIDILLFQTKVESLFKNKPSLALPEFHFPRSSHFKKGTISWDIEIMSLSELGLTLQSSQDLPSGTIIEVKSPLFDHIDIPPPHVKVVTSNQLENDSSSWSVKANYFGVTESVLQKIRAWIFTRQASREQLVQFKDDKVNE